MDGTIINYDREAKTGVIRAEDKKRYKFLMSDWGSGGEPRQGDLIDFEPDDDRATEIFVTSRSTSLLTVGSDLSNDLPPSALSMPDGNLSTAPGASVTSSSTSIAPPIVQTFTAPSGKGAKFFIAYFLAMVPTYILPYFGSNSMILGGISADVGAGLPPIYIWHICFFTVLIALAFVRGMRIQRGWLVAFPVIAGFFDLVAGFNWIPFIPTVMHAGALYVGASKDAVPGFDRDSVLPKVKWAYALLALTSLWATYKCMTSPWAMGASKIAYGFFPLIILAISSFIALRVHRGFGDNLQSAFESLKGQGLQSVFAVSADQPVTSQTQSVPPTETNGIFCSECGAKNEAAAKFCGECGTTI